MSEFGDRVASDVRFRVGPRLLSKVGRQHVDPLWELSLLHSFLPVERKRKREEYVLAHIIVSAGNRIFLLRRGVMKLLCVSTLFASVDLCEEVTPCSISG